MTRMFGFYFALLIIGLAFGTQLRNGKRCKTLLCEIKPFDLRFWYQGIETELRQININEGDDVIITCDGSCVGVAENPRLSWYGPNLRRIEENGNNRTYTEKSFSGQFSRLVLHDVTTKMLGRYTCRGWLGQRMGWRKKEINIATERSSKLEVTHQVTVAADLASQRSSKLEVTHQVTVAADLASHVNISSKFTCTSGVTIDAQKVCDGFPDCENGIDESNCVIGSICNEGSVACMNNEMCIPKHQICDSIAHCRDGSDELPSICNI